MALQTTWPPQAREYYNRLVSEFSQTPERAQGLVEAWMQGWAEEQGAAVTPEPEPDTTGFFRVRGVPLALIERVRVYRARHREHTTGEIVTAALAEWLDRQEGTA